MTAKAADIEIAEVKCTPAELTIAWQNSSYSVYNSLWLRDNAPAHRDPRTGQRLISLVDLPLEPRLRSAGSWPPGHLTVSWDDGETAVFSLQWLRAYDRSLRIGSRPTRLPWMGQPAAHFARSAYPDWVRGSIYPRRLALLPGTRWIGFPQRCAYRRGCCTGRCCAHRFRSRD